MRRKLRAFLPENWVNCRTSFLCFVLDEKVMKPFAYTYSAEKVPERDSAIERTCPFPKNCLGKCGLLKRNVVFVVLDRFYLFFL